MYVARKLLRGVSKTQNVRFQSKSALHLKNVCYKVPLCEYCQQQRCKGFTGFSIVKKMVGGGHPILRENLAKSDPLPFKNTDFQSMFARSTSAEHVLAKKTSN